MFKCFYDKRNFIIMRDEDSDFSRLRTVSSFDKGDSTTVAVDFAAQDLQRFSPPSLFVESLLEQLCKLVEKDPKSQRKLYLTICQKLHQMKLIDESYKLEEFEFMRTHYQKALYHFLTVAKATSVETKAVYPTTSANPSVTPDNILEWSRYSNEYQELEFIAKGGFGHVYKARHKLDGGVYAIKKIFVRCRSINGFLQNLKEVKMLAKLNHPNIVSYKAAWLEPIEGQERPVKAISPKKKDTSSSLEIVFERSSEEDKSESEEKSDSSSSDDSMSVSCNTQDNMICKYENKAAYQFKFSGIQPGLVQCAMLYIQMQLCSTTLREWLDERNQMAEPHIDYAKSAEIFKQIVQGVEYIHSQDIVHHDIKPSNIFVSQDLKEVQVGDFGLSCCLLAHSNSSMSVVSHQPGQFGTKLYAAPEQLNDICHPKSDIYSLGIVLLELIQPFSTSMERSKVISQLKLGHIPTNVTASAPNLARIISQTVTGNLKNRPTASELLRSLEETYSQNALQIIKEKEAIIQELQRENLAKDEEIAALKRRLQEFMSKYPSDS